MAFKNFLLEYWLYIAAFAIAVWNIFLHFKLRRIEVKQKRELPYQQLTKIISEFQKNIQALFSHEPEFLGFIKSFKKQLREGQDVLFTFPDKDFELLELKVENNLKLIEARKKEFSIEENHLKKNELLEQIKKKISESDFILQNEAIELINKKKLTGEDKIKKMQSELDNFVFKKSEIVDSILSIVNKLLEDLQMTSEWKITSSITIIKTISELQEACLRLNEVIVNSVDNESVFDNLLKIIRSQEYVRVKALSDSVINKMRDEVYTKF